MPRVHHRLLTILAVMLGLLSPCAAASPASAAPRRIVSLNLCADQLVIALADRDQIAGVTEWARDPTLSYYAQAARGLPFTHRSAEEVIALRPDLVIDASLRTRTILAPMAARGVRFVALPLQDSYPALITAIGQVAAAVGHPERGRALIARMTAQLAALGPSPGRGRVAAYYQREGYLTGTGTLVDDMLRRAGLINLAGRLGQTPLARLGLEQLATARPDFLILEPQALVDRDRGSAMLRHPLLDRVVPPSRHLVIPQPLTVCGTPGYPQAVAMLFAQVRASDAR